MNIRIAGIAPESIVDGKGIRFVIFTQGCPHRCPGCHNPSTHSFNGGTTYDTEDIAKMFESSPLITGITLSGGEPFAQYEACMELAKRAKEANLSVWCYTGYEFWEVIDNPLMKYIDVLVDGKFDESQKSLDLRFRGSLNQRVINVPKSFEMKETVLL